MRRTRIAVVLFLLMNCACARRHSGDANVLRMGVWLEPAGLDPHRTSAAGSYRLLELLYDGLMELDDSLEPVPALAARVELESPTVYRFELQPGVTFHSGEPLRARDAVYSLDRMRDPRTGSPLQERFAHIVRTEAIDDLTLRITLDRPYPSFLRLLARPDAAILPEGRRDGFDRGSYGTGPFRLLSYRPHEGAALDRNPSYRVPGLPRLAGIDMRFLPDALSRVAALESGELDLISHLPGKDVDRLRRNAAFQVIERESTGFEYIALNNRRPPLDKPEVRRALRLAVDTDALLAVEWFGNARPVLAWVLPPWHPDAMDPGRRSTRDLGEARRLLLDAGVRQGLALRLVMNQSARSVTLPAATVLEANWREAGIRLNIEFQDVGLYFANITSANFDVAITGAASYVDAEEYLCWFESHHPWNWSGFQDAATDRTLAAARFERDPDLRRSLYQSAQRRLSEDAVPVIPYSFTPVLYGASRRLRGFVPGRNFHQRGLAAAELSRFLQ